MPSTLQCAVGALLAQASALDHFEETLHLRALPREIDSPDQYLARWEFEISAPRTAAFRADQFDLFPGPIGKLLNAHPAIEAFEATLTRGRWKRGWGEAPWEFRPPGAVLAAALQGQDESATAAAYRFLVSTLSGSLCASFEGMDPALSSAETVETEGKASRLQSSNTGARPLRLPDAWQTEHSGQSLRLATLPYEPVCTENLTPWLKLLPCGRHRGLSALLAALVVPVAEAPLASLTLAVDVRSDTVVARSSLDVVLPGDAGSLPKWLQSFAARKVENCPAAASSVLRFWRRDESALSGAGQVELPTAQLSADLSQYFSGPWEESSSETLSVMRDMLSQEGRSERTHGRYLLRLSNPGPGRRVRFLDQLPFFIRPLWHTVRVVWTSADGEVELLGGEALRRLGVQFTASDGVRSPTDFSLSVDLPTGSSVSVFLDVLKNFINFREFSYACEKGFDVGGAVWLDAELGASGAVGTGDFVSLGPTLSQSAPWRLHFTEGMLVMVPMPDFSMPFNVVALSSTAATFFFGSVFRITGAGGMPHWCTERGGKPAVLHPLQKFALLGLLASLGINALTPEHMAQISAALPQDGWGPELYGYLVFAKDKVDSILAKR
ncbi:unnamed protein product [Effrenium voratum]|uniref:Uncharacterized protein n=1 Tax=Effrenium voratum TaxID=2562239 RepID=A0AA36JQU6_9DINO|nr:unnamed protein product [Effrenium voratum]